MPDIQEKDKQVVGVDVDLDLFDLTDLFYSYYRYHDKDYLVDYEHTYVTQENSVLRHSSSLSRFDALRRIEAARLGSRPFLGGKGVPPHKPNISLGYLRLLFDYLVLPYKSIFTDSDLVKVRVNKRLYDKNNLTIREQEDQQIRAQDQPNIESNKEISDDISDAYSEVLKQSKDVKKCIDQFPLRIVQDGAVAALHSDLEWRPECIQLLDLITEPQAENDVSTWHNYFVIRKLSAQEAIEHLREAESSDSSFWNPEAIRWALENSMGNRGLLNRDHYYGATDSSQQFCGENFSVKSFISDKGTRRTNVNGYYGNMLVVEAYYTNTKGKINKAIFFPSQDTVNTSKEDRDKEGLDKANFLFLRENIPLTLAETITVIPFDRGEAILERQRAYGHELFSVIETIMRIDSSIINTAILMGTLFYKDIQQSPDAQTPEDLEIAMGDTVNLGERDLVTNTPFTADLNAMLGVRSVLLQQANFKTFLGGLDGTETSGNGRGANLAGLRLVRDGRVHKHNVEDLTEGLSEFYINIYRRIIDMYENKKTLLEKDPLINKVFFGNLIDVQGHNPDIFEFDQKDIIQDTGLPYWMEVKAVSNGGSHFGAAEMILYSEIKNVFGDGLDQSSLQALNRMGIKSLLGSQDAIDILGDPKDLIVTEQDQIYRATLETSSVIGSVDGGTLSFEAVLILPTKDDHVVHLQQAHNPKAMELIQRLDQGEFTPQTLDEMSEEQLETRNNLILKLAALASHIQLHQQQLERFGKTRDDINKLREETNNILQSAEGLLNNLQLNLRALQTKRAEKELRLRNLSPENEAEKAKTELELQKLEVQKLNSEGQLALANKIADQRDQQHRDKQLSRARDRAQKERQQEESSRLKEQEIQASVLLQTREGDR